MRSVWKFKVTGDETIINESVVRWLHVGADPLESFAPGLLLT